VKRTQRDFVVDAFLLAVAGIAVWASSEIEGPPANVGWLPVFAATTLILLGSFHFYRPRFGPRFLDDLAMIVAATAVAAMAMTFVRVLFTDNPAAADQAVRTWLFAAAYLAAGRGGIRLVEARERRHGGHLEPTLIIGAGQVGHLVAQRLIERPEFGLEPVAFFDHEPLEIERRARLPVVGEGMLAISDPAVVADELEATVRRLGIERVVLTFSLSGHKVELAVVRRCQDLGVSVSLVPRLFEGLPDETELERLGGLPLVTVYPRDPRGWQFALKYAVDRVLAAVLLVLVSPLLAIGAVGVLLTMGRPVLFRQDRVGMDGQEFQILKFRTMRESANRDRGGHAFELAEGTAPGGIEGEDRRTRFGTFLRATSIDELPQLVNVLRGEMSLIGPRPERVDFARTFDESVHRYADRARVKSGITGWAQVHGLRGKTSLADRVEWDNYYIENWSPWLDLKIAFLTLLAVFRDRSE
jgi:exopolysaccharide biosynthesis polyprenyl glycosylphosphotransferase